MDKILFDRNINLALSASAGTGKTRTLSLRFLDLYLKHQNLSSIYALTFTNKASQEMRERIIRYLSLLTSTEKVTEEEKDIVRIFSSRFKDITNKARNAKHQLLSNFTDFNVSTIHSFLNYILKTMPFQTNVLPDFRVIESTEENIIIDKVLDDFLNDAVNNAGLKILINRALNPKETNVKGVVKALFLSLLPRMLEIVEISESLEVEREKLSESFVSLKSNCLKINNSLKNGQYHKNKNLEKKIDRIENLLKQEAKEKLVVEIIDLFSKNYFKELEEKQVSGSELKHLTNSVINQAKNYTLLNNRKLLIDNLRLLFALHGKFQNAKRDINVVTFNDLETYALKALSNNQMKEYLYFKSSSQIEHLLIDEFQDTSIIQWKILEPIIEEITAGDNHSFFYVGDPNQAIYRFRGGESRLFEIVKNKFPGKIQSEYLTENYRSKEKIVSFVNSVFSSNPGYKPMQPIQKEGGWVIVEDLGEYKQKEGAEAVQSKVVKIIKNLKNKDYEYSDIAILVRRNKTGIKLSETLEEAGIPTRSESKTSLFYQEGVQDIINLLRWVTNTHEDFYFILLLLSPLFSVGEKEIENLNREKNTTLFKLLQEKHSSWSVTKQLKKILNISDSARPYELISFIYSELKVMGKYKYSEPFLSLLETAYKFENEKGISLASFIEYLKQYGPAIEFTAGELDGVQILTCHKAKGLEFPIVLLPETVWNMEGRENDQFVFQYSETEHELKLSDAYYRKDPLLKLFNKEIFQDEKKRTFKDELNNLYVAMTRAKEGLWIAGYKNTRLSKSIENQRNESLNMSNTWFDFITNPIKLKMENGIYTSGEIKNFEILQKKKKSPLVKLRGDIHLHPKAKKVITPTGKSLIISGTQREAFRWGEIYHYALSKIKKVDKKTLLKIIHSSIDITKKIYGRSKREQEEIGERLNHFLKDILTDKDLQFIFYTNSKVNVRIEMPIYFKNNRTEISGRIDRLLIKNNSIEIIDYKKGEKDKKYIKQMKYYRTGISKVYPNKEIKCYFIWLDNPRGERIERIF